ncbi:MULTISPECIES: DUF5305 domain-containing protein [Haloarcula]|uniref:DUF5305 domain-containing protein n=1 Tax=Haloarcula TaxID=2237 RepID=UPI0023E8C63C|nr:DUF5305 domain-containing protein [Halomicroarcula sp. SHR3]
MRDRRRQLRILLADNWTVVLLALLAVVALGAYLTYSGYVSPGTETEERQVESWESTGAFTHQATVRIDTSVYQEGDVLRDRGTYFRAIAPVLDGEFVYRYTASGGGNLTVTTDTTLVFRSVDTDQENESEYWRTEEQLSSTTETDVGPGGSVSTPFRVNVSEASQRIETIDEQLGGTPGEKQLLVAATVAVSGTRNGKPVDVTRTYRLPVTTEGSLYRVDDPGESVESDGQTERVTVPADPGPVQSLGGPALFGLGLAGLVGVVAARRYAPPVMETERTWHRYQQTRAEFDEWITAGRVPPAADGPPVVTVDTLSGLVDLAIDTGERVVEDERRGACLVMQDSRWYRYEMPPEPATGRESDDATPTTDDTSDRED